MTWNWHNPKPSDYAIDVMPTHQFTQLVAEGITSRYLCMEMCGAPNCPGRCHSEPETIYLETECGWIIEIEE